jgi:hypothetical protein
VLLRRQCQSLDRPCTIANNSFHIRFAINMPSVGTAFCGGALWSPTQAIWLRDNPRLPVQPLPPPFGLGAQSHVPWFDRMA